MPDRRISPRPPARDITAPPRRGYGIARTSLSAQGASGAPLGATMPPRAQHGPFGAGRSHVNGRPVTVVGTLR